MKTSGYFLFIMINLKHGYIVKCRNGEFRRVIKCYLDKYFLEGVNEYISLDTYKEDLLSIESSEFDIIEVYQFRYSLSLTNFLSKTLKLLWKREEVTSLVILDNCRVKMKVLNISCYSKAEKLSLINHFNIFKYHLYGYDYIYDYCFDDIKYLGITDNTLYRVDHLLSCHELISQLPICFERDLQPGMVIEDSKGIRYLVTLFGKHKLLLNSTKCCHISQVNITKVFNIGTALPFKEYIYNPGDLLIQRN